MARVPLHIPVTDSTADKVNFVPEFVMASILLNLDIVSAALLHLRISPTLTKLLKLAI